MERRHTPNFSPLNGETLLYLWRFLGLTTRNQSAFEHCYSWKPKNYR